MKTLTLTLVLLATLLTVNSVQAEQDHNAPTRYQEHQKDSQLDYQTRQGETHSVPETGSTFALMVIAAGGLFLLRKKTATQ